MRTTWTGSIAIGTTTTSGALNVNGTVTATTSRARTGPLFLDLLGGLQSHRVQHSRDLFAQSLPAGGPEFLAPFDSLRDDTEKMNGSVVFTIAFGRIAFAEPCIRQRRSLLYVYCTFEKLKVRQCVREPRDHHQSLRCRPSKIGAVLSEHKSAARSMPAFDPGRFRSGASQSGGLCAKARVYWEFLRACKATEKFGRGRGGGGRGTGIQRSLAALRSVSRWFATEQVCCNPSD
jgi:hypothetical protein